MKKPGLSMAALLLAVSTNISASTITPEAPVSLWHTSSYGVVDTSIFNSIADYQNRVITTAWSSVAAISEVESDVPVPAAAWLFISGLVGMISVSRRKRK